MLPGRGNLLPRVPARSGIQARFRAPFWLIPGDLILAAPFLLLTSKDTYTEMAAAAATGGLIPWQRRFHTPVGSFQLVLGREVGATFYGFTGGLDELFTSGRRERRRRHRGFRSVLVEVPLLEYEAFRSYGARQSLGVRFQFGAGFDKPVKVQVLDPPGSPPPSLRTRYFGTSVWSSKAGVIF